MYLQEKNVRKLKEEKLGLKASFEKEKTKINTTRCCRICEFQRKKIISGIFPFKLYVHVEAVA